MGALPWPQMLAVAVGAAAGGLLRWAAGLWLNSAWLGFPLGTLLVNCAGGLLMGLAMVVFSRFPAETLRLLLVTGFLGGLTTFSAYSGESLALLQRGQVAMALGHTLAHVAGALLCASAGFSLGRLLLKGWGA
ncbi:CrcB family protein [Ideonella sp. BN130291]|uniref:CrcB family protein n=1 Tax=Ideonella sp. BN130291 TaxID=3112940 RepID=UPI002E26B9A7|nr:CrcB family protein [Ideonella sp. BN130291]